jgi:uncharacterized protein (DUF488 family)
MTQQVYTFGYSGHTSAQLKQLAEELDAIVFDIRFSPRSRDPQWSGKRLRAALGHRYQHIRELGNENYKSGPIQLVDFVQLVDFEAGRTLIEDSNKPVILMCVCHNYHDCHRSVVASKLAAFGIATKEARPATPRLYKQYQFPF